MKHINLVHKILYNRHLYNVYFALGGLAISILRLFVRPDEKLILFVSFGGRRFDDSPKAIYDGLLLDHRFDGYNLVWAFLSPEKYVLPRGNKIKIDTIQYFVTALKARCWVTNSSITRGLSFKGKNTFYYNSWHGTALKKLGNDIHTGNESFSIKKRKKAETLIDTMSAQGQYDVDLFSRVFDIPTDVFSITGLPRNDRLAKKDLLAEKEIRKALNIPFDKKVILYAPTFREYDRDDADSCYIAPPINIENWEKELGDSYVLLFRAHYEIIEILNIEESDFVRNVTDYPVLNDLLMIADILITDYSSICFDYSIMCRPILWFAYDYDLYCEKRGIYFDVRDYFEEQFYQSETNLLEGIKRLQYEHSSQLTKDFRDCFVTEFGSATTKVLDIIYKAINIKG